MAFWNKKPKQTFRQRVDEFWDWFPTVAPGYGQLLLDNRGNEVVEDAGKKLEKLLPGICWGFGIESADQGRFTFNLTGEGQIAKQLLAEHWLSAQIPVSGWTFFGSRQPSLPDALNEMRIEKSTNVLSEFGGWSHVVICAIGQRCRRIGTRIDSSAAAPRQ